MTYSSSSTFYRLGYSVTWNVVNSPLHFSKSVRLNIVLNTFLKGMLKYFRIKLVKWIGNMEGNYFKLSLIIFDKTYPKYYKFRGKLKPMKFFLWNYNYFKKTSWSLGMLRDYYTKRHYKPRFKLGSGNYWHKFFTSIYFILSKNFKHSRKTFKNGTIDAEFLGGIRSESSNVVKLNNMLSFSMNKYSRLPQYQFMFKFYFKLYLYLNKWKHDNLSFHEKKFKLFFFLKTMLLNFFLKKNINLIRNKPLRRFQSRFVNSARTRYTLTKRILSHRIYYFNYLNYIKGPNYQWRSSGRVVKSYKSNLKYNNKIPWALVFLRGNFFNISYKKIMRRNFMAVTHLHSFLERMRMFNFLVKNYIVWKKNKNNNNLRIKRKDMFFNNKFINYSVKRLKKYYKFLQSNIKYKKTISNSDFRNEKYKLELKNILFNNHYFFNEKENLYMNKYGFFKKSVKNGIIPYIRKKFKKFVFNDVFLKKKDVMFDINIKKLYFFKEYYLKLRFLEKTNNELLKKNLKFFKNDSIILQKQTLSSFQKKLSIGINNNPFDQLFNNFLFFFLFPKYDFLSKKKIKKKININNYFSAKFLFDNSKFKFKNGIEKNYKLLIFLKFYGELLILNNIMKKKIFVYKNELNIFLFRSFWSLEFFKIFYNFKFRRLNFEKLFKKSRNNTALLNYKKIKINKKPQKKIVSFNKKQIKINKNLLNSFFKNDLKIKYYFFRCIILRNKNLIKISNNSNSSIINNVLNINKKNLKEVIDEWKNKIKIKKNIKNKTSIVSMKNNFLIPKHSYLNKRLKIKMLFFKYKIKILLKKKKFFGFRRVFEFRKEKKKYLKIWKKQLRIYYLPKNKKLLYHKKFRHNYNTLIKNMRSLLFFSKSFSWSLSLINYVGFINDLFKKSYVWKRRIILKFIFYKKVYTFNQLYFLFKVLFNSFFKFSNYFLKKLFLLGFYFLKKNINLFFFVKQISVFFKSQYNYSFSTFSKFSKINRIKLLKKKHLKKYWLVKNFFTKLSAFTTDSPVYIDSLKRYMKAQVRNNSEVKIFFKSKYSNLKDFRLRKLSFKNRLKFLKTLNIRRNKKYKKNFKAKSRNKYLGRVNYRKYRKFQNLELREEILKRKRISNYAKKNKRMYMYFMLQKNLSKGILLDQPKIIFKSFYNAGAWFKQNKNNIKLSNVSQIKPISLLLTFNSFVTKLFQKKIFNNFKNFDKNEVRNFLFYLDRFKKNKFSSVPWRISKKFYFSKFYLDNIPPFRINKLFYNKKTSVLNRSVITQHSVSGQEHSILEQYWFRYIKHLEKTASITNRIFSKHRVNWTKDFFSYKNHFKIFKLVQQKLYYNIKLTQKNKIKNLKVRLVNRLKKNKIKLFNNTAFNLKFKALGTKKKQKLILYYFKNLNYQIKEFIFFKTKSNLLNFFLQHFFKLNYCTPLYTLKLIKNTFFKKMINSSVLVYKNNDQSKIFNFQNKFLKNKTLNKMYYSWLKLFLWKFEFTKIFFLTTMPNNLETVNSQSSVSHKVRKDKPWNILFFGKFLKFFKEKVDINKYFELYNKNFLTKYEELAELAKFFQSFFFFFFLQNKNTKKLLQMNFNLNSIYKMKVLNLLTRWKIISFSQNTADLYYQVTFNGPLKFYIYTYFFNNFLIFKIQKIKNNYYFRKKMYSTRFWIKNKKFLFWLEQQFEKSFKMNVKLNYISATKAISKYCRNGFDYYFLFSKRIHAHRFFQGWRQQSIYADVLWIVIISVKYYSAIFLSNMLSEQIVKRKKQWPFIKIIRTVVKEVLPKNLMKDSRKVDGLRIMINGKINGRDRSTSYLIYKFYKDKQISKIHQIYLKVDYSLSFANSKYGVFGIKVWISRL